MLLRSRTILLAAVLMAGWTSHAKPVHAARLYWSGNTIGQMDLDGGNAKTLVSQAGLQLAIDHQGGKMFWASGGTSAGDHIFRANLDGTGVESIKEAYFVAGGVAVDPRHRVLYWAGSVDGPHNERSGIHALRLGDLSSEYLFESRITDAPLYLNRAGDEMYVIDTDDAVLSHHAIDGRQLPHSASATGFAIGPGETHIYWTDTNALMRSKPDGSDETRVGTFPFDYIPAIAIDPASERLFFSHWDAIYRANLDLTGIEEIHHGAYASSLMIVPEPGTIVLALVGLWGHVCAGRGRMATRKKRTVSVGEDSRPEAAGRTPLAKIFFTGVR